MTSPTPTVADEIERYLRTGDTDPYHAAWSARGVLERARLASADLESALVTEVCERGHGWQPPAALVALEDVTAFTRTKVEPMVRGLFPRTERDAVMALLESSVVFITPSNIEQALRAGRVPHGTSPTCTWGPSARNRSLRAPRGFSD